MWVGGSGLVGGEFDSPALVVVVVGSSWSAWR